MTVPSLSLVLPAHNEADNIVECVERARSALDGLGGSWEIVAVDDGSRDGTWERLQALRAREPRLLAVRHPENRGYGAALRTGFRRTSRELVCFTDADLQLDPAELPRLVALASSADIVVGYRQRRRDPLHRRVNAWAWGILVRQLFDLPVRDVNCAFKLFHRRVLDGVDLRSTGAFVNTELLARAGAAGFRVAEVPVSHYPRRAGRQTGARPAVVARAFSELWQLSGELGAQGPAAARGLSVSSRPMVSSGRAISLARTTR